MSTLRSRPKASRRPVLSCTQVLFPGYVVGGASPRGVPRDRAWLKWWTAALRAGAGEWMATAPRQKLARAWAMAVAAWRKGETAGAWGAARWAEVQARRDPATAVCETPGCKRRVRFAPPLPARTSRLGWPRAKTSGVAIRCAFCMRVFCLEHATEHFGACREGKLADMLAARMTKLLTKLKPRPGALDKLADAIAKRLAARMRKGRRDGRK